MDQWINRSIKHYINDLIWCALHNCTHWVCDRCSQYIIKWGFLIDWLISLPHFSSTKQKPNGIRKTIGILTSFPYYESFVRFENKFGRIDIRVRACRRGKAWGNGGIPTSTVSCPGLHCKCAGGNVYFYFHKTAWVLCTIHLLFSGKIAGERGATTCDSADATTRNRGRTGQIFGLGSSAHCSERPIPAALPRWWQREEPVSAGWIFPKSPEKSNSKEWTGRFCGGTDFADFTLMLNGWLFDWLNCDWSIDHSIDWLIDRLIDWLIDWLFGFSGWQDGVVQPDTLVALYPGTVYDAGEPVLLQSLGNPYIIQCVDGRYIDGKSRGISRLIYKYIPLQHKLVEKLPTHSITHRFLTSFNTLICFVTFFSRSCANRDFFHGHRWCDVSWLETKGMTNPYAVGQYVNNARSPGLWHHCVVFKADHLLLLYYSTKFPICLSYLQIFNLMSHTTNSRYRPSLTWSTGSTSRTSTFPQKKTSKSIPKKCRYLLKLLFIRYGFQSVESFRLFFLFRCQAASNDWSNQSACYSG